MHGLERQSASPKVTSRFSSASTDGRMGGGVAGALRRKRLRDPRSIGLNIVPLVDVTFLLMIFFVIAGTFEAWEGVLGSRMISSGAAEGDIPLPISPVLVRIRQTGSTPDQFEVLIEALTRGATPLDEVSGVLRQIREQPGFGGGAPVVIHSDGNVRWDHVVEVWNAAVRAGYERVAFSDS